MTDQNIANVSTETNNTPVSNKNFVGGLPVIEGGKDGLYTIDGFIPVGVDLAAKVFQVHYQNKRGLPVNRQLNFNQFKEFILKSADKRLYIMEGCSSSSSWAHLMREHGDKVRVVNPITTHLKLLSSGQFKDDRNDARILWQAAFIPNLRQCRIRSTEELNLKSLFRIRQQTKKELDAAVNETRALFIEVRAYDRYRINNAQSALGSIDDYYQRTGKNADTVFNLQILEDKIRNCQRTLDLINKRIEQFVSTSPEARLLLTIPGVGPLTAAIMVVVIGDIRNFKNARSLRAYLGIVTSHTGSGGKVKMGKLCTSGDKTLKGVFYEGAQSIIQRLTSFIKNGGKPDEALEWLYSNMIKNTKGYKKQVIRIMAKMVSICYGVLASGKPYDKNINSCLGNGKIRIKTHMTRNVQKSRPAKKTTKPRCAKANGQAGTLPTATAFGV